MLHKDAKQRWKKLVAELLNASAEIDGALFHKPSDLVTPVVQVFGNRPPTGRAGDDVPLETWD